MPKVNLKSLSIKDMESFVRGSGLPAFRAKQILHWIYDRRAQGIHEITELSKDIRARLSERAYISNLELLNRQISDAEPEARTENRTEKFLFGLQDSQTIESVLIPDNDRLTLCISSQAGCAMGCKFCLSGKFGLKRNLKAYEIVDQIISVSRDIQPARITNVVLMGMGEPLSNFENVTEALWKITGLIKISPRRITLSTAGIAPNIVEIYEKAPMVNLAVSLNATTDRVRDYIMPINKKYPLNVLLNTCRGLHLPHRRRITFEYVLLKGINDTDDDARRLIILLKGIPSKVNLIPFNPYEGAEFRSPDNERVQSFQQILLTSGLTALIRKSKGQDILAACGQLRARYMT
jgi:23S rRNA (adenine2503-C2)-methyltransferase